MKICQACGHRPAAVEFIQQSGDERREMALCRECALSIGMRAQVEAFQRLSQLLMGQGGELSLEARRALATICANCGLSFEEFVHTGLLGCPQCYTEFKELLTPVLRRMHGVIKQAPADSHEEPAADQKFPESPEAPSELRAQLEAELQVALLEENYEHAAELRERLKKLR